MELILNSTRINLIGLFVSFLTVGLSVWYFDIVLSWFDLVALAGFVCLFAIVHELIHYAWFKRYADVVIGVTFFCKVLLTPYNIVKTPMKVDKFRIGLVLPTLFLVPYCLFLAYLINVKLVLLACALLAGGTSDLLMWGVLLAVPYNTQVLDHPTEIGVVINSV